MAEIIGKISNFCKIKIKKANARKAKKKYCIQKTLSVMLSIALMMAFMPQKVFGIDDYVEENGNWIIYTAQGLVAFRDAVNGGNSFGKSTVTLANDIDLTSVCSVDSPWVSIGNYSNYNSYKSFAGTFDGAGHKIYGLYIDGAIDNTGFFGYVSDHTGYGYPGIVKNVTLEKVNCKEGGGKGVGGLSGRSSSAKFQNCTVIGTICGGDCVGGIVGGSYNGSAQISGCSFSGTIFATGEKVGGIYGGNTDSGYYDYTKGILNHCSCNNTTVNGKKEVGGVAGACESISDCSFDGTVEASEDDAGGIAGIADNTAKCLSRGSVSGNNEVGGITGSFKSSVKECGSEANVQGQRYVGGISGCAYTKSGGNSNIDILHCYSTGIINGASEIGGILGSAPSTSTKIRIFCCICAGPIYGTGFEYDNSRTLCYIGGIMGYDLICVCDSCVCLSPEIRGTGDPNKDVIAFISAAYLNDRPGTSFYSGYGDPVTGDDIRCFYRSDLGPAPGVGYDGNPYDIVMGWQKLFKYADLADFDSRAWIFPNIDLTSLAYSVAALPIARNMSFEQHPRIRYLNDYFYSCKAEDVNLLPADIPRVDLGDGYFRLWMNEDFYDYKKGTQLKIVDPIVGWVHKDDPNGAVLTELGSADEYSARELVATFRQDTGRVLEAPVGDGTVVRVIDTYNQIPENWRLVVEPVNGDLQSYGYDHALAAETEHGKLFLIYFVNEKGEKVGEVNLDKPVRVMVPVPLYYDINDLKVFFVDPNDKDTEHKLIGTEMMSDHNYAVFETPHFSPYALIDILNEQEKAEQANSKNPATSDELYTMGAIVASGILAGAFLVLFAKFASSKKRKANKLI